MGLSNYEKESVILFNEAEGTASVYTHNRALKEHLLRLCAAYPGQAGQTADNGHGGLTFTVPKRWIKVKPPRTLSPAQREVLDRMNGKTQGKSGNG